MSRTVSNPSGVAVMIMDFQNTIVGMVPEADRPQLLANAQAVIALARERGFPVNYVVVQFREGHPEVAGSNKMFSGIKAGNLLVEGTVGAAIHDAVTPHATDCVIVKRRVSAFGTTDLDAVLSAQGAQTLVLCGISTGGVVLSTVRHAADMDYRIVVVRDACADPDAETHRVLMDKVFQRQTTVTTTAELAGVLDSLA
jgi:nicotinamidase-related amidase